MASFFIGLRFLGELYTRTSQFMSVKKKRDFDPNTFLAIIGEGRKIVPFQKKQIIFAQGDACDAVFYIQKGNVKDSPLSPSLAKKPQ